MTFEMVDPLWVIDLSSPAEPVIAGHLEVPGFSTYIEPLGERLVAVGINDLDDWRPTVLLYDVSDPSQPVELDREVIGQGYADSQANSDEKAFKVLPDAGLILMPFDYWRQTDQEYVNALQLVDFSTDKLKQRAALAHPGTVLRSEAREDNIWLLSQLALQTADITGRDNPQRLALLELASYVSGVKAAGQYALVTSEQRVGNQWTSHGCKLQSFWAQQADNGTALDTLELPGWGARIILGDKIGYVATMTGQYGQTTHITAVDLEQLPKLVVLAEKQFYVNLDGATTLYGYGSMWGWDWLSNQPNPVLVHDDLLVVFTGAPAWYGWYEGIGSTLEALTVRLVDGQLQLADRLKIEQNHVLRLLVSGSQLCFTYFEPVSSGLLMTKPRARYYLTRYDISDDGQFSERGAVNVPGVVLGKNGSQLYTADPVWREWQLHVRLCVLELKDDQAILQGSYQLPDDQQLLQLRMIGSQVCIITQEDLGGYLPLKDDSNWWWLFVGLVLHQNGLIEYGETSCAKNRTKRAIGLIICPYMGIGVEPALQGLHGRGCQHNRRASGWRVRGSHLPNLPTVHRSCKGMCVFTGFAIGGGKVFG